MSSEKAELPYPRFMGVTEGADETTEEQVPEEFENLGPFEEVTDPQYEDEDITAEELYAGTGQFLSVERGTPPRS